MQELQETQVQYLGQVDLLEEEMQPTLGFLPEKLHGQRSMAGYSSRGRTELNMTEWLSTQV